MLSKLLQTNSKFGLRMSNNNFITSLQQDKCLHSLLLFTSSIAFSTLITRKNILKNENSTSSTISSSLKNFSTSSNDNVEEKKYKKSNVYTRTGDKGKSSVSKIFVHFFLCIIILFIFFFSYIMVKEDQKLI